jgi:tRNA threonylcarbamoyl adenosine modification protein YeaZ
VSIILAIDTSFGTSVALVSAGKVLAERNIVDTMKHAELIGETIFDVLTEAGVTPSDIESVVAGRGPAPFTGLRVGIAAATMFAAGSGADLFGALPTLKASTNEPLLVTADARRKEVYWALYSGLDEHGVPIGVEGPGVMKPADLEEYLTDRNVHPVRTEEPITATNLALLAEAQQAAGILSKDVSALYLRAADAVEPKARVPKGAGL